MCWNLSITYYYSTRKVQKRTSIKKLLINIVDDFIKMSIGTIYEKAYKGDFNQVKAQLDTDASLIKTPDSNNRLLIHWAALGGNENLVDYMLRCDSPLEPQDDTCTTPLILAASAGRFEVVRLLVGKGANVNHKTNRNQTALHYASSKGHKEVVKFLINADANVNSVDVLGATPLHRAAAQGKTDIVEILLSSPHIKVNLCDSTGNTPLHLACEEEREGVASMLVKAGAQLDIKNKEEKTPLDLTSSKLKQTLLSLIE